MKTRIRELRQRHGMTLKELADRIGTTPQTIQRLETSNMTVSTDWLERIAVALSVEPIELLEAYQRGKNIPLLGRTMRGGYVLVDSTAGDPVDLFAPTSDPVAVTIGERTGGYEVGSVAIGARRYGPDIAGAAGKDCIVGLADGSMRLCRLLGTADPVGYQLVGLTHGDPVEIADTVEWVAPLVLIVRHV